MLGYGQDIVSARKLAFLSLGQFTANTTVTPAARFLVPPGHPDIRIVGIHVACDAIPADPDGTMVLNALVNDVSEGADDTLVSAQDLETLVLAANKAYECTLAADSAEVIRTLQPGDTIRFTLVNNSAAIGTNPNTSVAIEYICVPRAKSAEDLPGYVGYPSQMTQF